VVIWADVAALLLDLPLAVDELRGLESHGDDSWLLDGASLEDLNIKWPWMFAKPERSMGFSCIPAICARRGK
jgi:hypothetical protein